MNKQGIFYYLPILLIVFATMGVFSGCKKEVGSAKKESCNTDADCSGNQICSGGTCQDKEQLSCQSDEDCDANQVCTDGYCRDKETTSCQSDADCNDDEVCNKDTGKCEKSVECNFDSDCGTGKVCIDYKCNTAGCTSDSDCSNGKVCDQNRGECIDDTSFRVISAYPENGTTGVGTNVTLKLKFNKPVDRQYVLNNTDSPVLFLFPKWENNTNINFEENDTVISISVNLDQDKTYGFGTLYMRSADGDVLDEPYVSYFYTGDNPPSAYISGKVVLGSEESGYSVANSVVILIKSFQDLDQDGPTAVVFTNQDGTFRIPWVAPGRYTLMGMADADGDGQITMEGDSKDAIGFNADRVFKFIIVDQDPVTGETITLYTPKFGDGLYKVGGDPAIVASTMGNKTEIVLEETQYNNYVSDATVKVNDVQLDYVYDNPDCTDPHCPGKYVDTNNQIQYSAGTTYSLNINVNNTTITNIKPQTMPASFAVDINGECHVNQPVTFSWGNVDNADLFYVLILDHNGNTVYPTQNELDAILPANTTELTVDETTFTQSGQYYIMVNAMNLGYGNIFSGNLINAREALIVTRTVVYQFNCN